jgi:cell division protease FtsH
MSFMPGQQDGGRLPAVRTFLFWLLMILLAVVLWKMASNGRPNKNVRTISYSDFLAQMEKNNVKSARYFLSQTTAEIDGELREPPEQFGVTVPKEAIPNLTDQLRKQGVRIDVAASASGDWVNFFVNFAPLILLVAFWIFMMKRYRLKREEKR